ncbi:hypothetical protein TorRG33x02_193370, partial [Trema orientale]
CDKHSSTSLVGRPFSTWINFQKCYVELRRLPPCSSYDIWWKQQIANGSFRRINASSQSDMVSECNIGGKIDGPGPQKIEPGPGPLTCRAPRRAKTGPARSCSISLIVWSRGGKIDGPGQTTHNRFEGANEPGQADPARKKKRPDPSPFACRAFWRAKARPGRLV